MEDVGVFAGLPPRSQEQEMEMVISRRPDNCNPQARSILHVVSSGQLPGYPSHRSQMPLVQFIQRWPGM